MRVFFALLAGLGLALPAAPGLAQSLTPAAGLQMCDPLLTPTEDQDDGDQEDTEETRTVLYDQETSETLANEQAIMDALYEETWDLATGADTERRALCSQEVSYVILWAQAMGTDDAGAPAVVAEGFMRLIRGGSFEFTFADRPYSGTWAVGPDARMTLTAAWLNGGAPLAAPVERVVTPVEYADADGNVDRYDEVVYRVGPFRLQPINTSAKGVVRDCACH